MIKSTFTKSGIIASISASGSTITGATPPCSNALLVPGDDLEFKYQPTGPEPINVKNAVLGLVTNNSPAFLSQTTA